jgi:hypothetical protein
MAKGWFSAIPPAALAVLLAGAGSCHAQATWLNPNPGGYGSGYCDGGSCGKHGGLGGRLCALCSGANGPHNVGMGPTYTTAYNYTVDLSKPGVYGPPPWPFIWDWTFYSYYPAFYPNVSNYALQPSAGAPVLPPGFLPAPGAPLPGAAVPVPVPVPGTPLPPAINGKEPPPERLPPPSDRRK